MQGYWHLLRPDLNGHFYVAGFQCPPDGGGWLDLRLCRVGHCAVDYGMSLVGGGKRALTPRHGSITSLGSDY